MARNTSNLARYPDESTLAKIADDNRSPPTGPIEGFGLARTTAQTSQEPVMTARMRDIRTNGKRRFRVATTDAPPRSTLCTEPVSRSGDPLPGMVGRYPVIATEEGVVQVAATLVGIPDHC